GCEDPVLRDQRLQHRDDRGGLGIAQRQDARDELVAGAHIGRDRGLASFADRDDLHEVTARHGREALHLEHRLEDEVRLLGCDAGRRDDGDVAAHAIVENEVPPCHLADEAGEHGQVDVLEVERDGGLGSGPPGGGEGAQEERGGDQSHRRSYTRVRVPPSRTMSTATRGSLRNRSRKARSDAGSLTTVPFTRCTTSPSWRPRRRKMLSSLIWKRRKPDGRPSATSATARSCVINPPMLSTTPSSSRRSTMKASAPVRRMRAAGAGTPDALSGLAVCAPSVRRSPGGASSRVDSTPPRSRVTRSQLMATMRAPRISSPTR